jgi:hypothetical protein
MVNRRTGFIVDGHARIEEAIGRGEPSVPVLYVDLAPEEEALVLASFDPIGAMAGQAADRLAELLAGITVDDERGSAAGSGVATFSGGTGKFTGFQARVDVSADSTGLWHWEGTYSFSPSD